jgi:hypothetical protein
MHKTELGQMWLGQQGRAEISQLKGEVTEVVEVGWGEEGYGGERAREIQVTLGSRVRKGNRRKREGEKKEKTFLDRLDTSVVVIKTKNWTR